LIVSIYDIKDDLRRRHQLKHMNYGINSVLRP